MGNLNFAHNAGFSWYCLLLMASGIAMVVIGADPRQAMARRIWRLVFGVGYFVYGFYLAFVFAGGHYLLFFQAFLLPLLLIFDWYRISAAKRRIRAQATMPGTGDSAGAATVAGGRGTIGEPVRRPPGL